MLAVSALLFFFSVSQAKPVVEVGSKTFTEGYVLAEIISQTIEEVGEVQVKRRFGLGGTGITYQALIDGEIDLYPEYTGTIYSQILKKEKFNGVDQLETDLSKIGLVLGTPFGFNNTYALAVRGELAKSLELEKISDLKEHPNLRLVISHEFLKRADGFSPLIKKYGLKMNHVNGIEHSLAYEAIQNKKADIIDVYTTDGKLAKFGLKVLEDDQHFFPTYLAAVLARKAFVDKYPETWRALEELGGTISTQRMVLLNHLVENEGKTFEEAASVFLEKEVGKKRKRSFLSGKFIRLTLEHIYLVVISLFAAVVVGVPVGIFAARLKVLGHAVLALSGVLQTIPSLALLCFLIPLFGIGFLPSLVALFLYGLLPIVRGTFTGITSIDRKLNEASFALGISKFQQLWLIELPLASVNIMNGIKTSAVINVGTATLAALIGAGGYGTLIVTGLALNDVNIILSGAIPSAVLALVVHGFFEVLDRLVVPKGLKLNQQH